jgi:hypothetical protein
MRENAMTVNAGWKPCLTLKKVVLFLDNVLGHLEDQCLAHPITKLRIGPTP